jgi:opacity protein-like surface antigen
MKQTLIAATAAVLLAACGSSSSDSTPKLDSVASIGTYLDAKTLVMTGADIPSHPNGYNQNMNLGAATQCYNSTTIAIASGVWHVTSKLGTLNGAPTVGSVGTCDRATVAGSDVKFDSTTVLIENVAGNGTCFDISVTYTGFGQEGRGAFSADGKTLQLELYFNGKATHHRCADGAVGSTGVTVNGAAFTGNAVQTYRIQ